MTNARRTVVREGLEGTYHCMARCVRRAFLCGFDHLTGNNYDHRKDWIRNRLQKLVEVFAVEVCGYAIMDNHLHLILRNRPDLVASWSDKEVAIRWRNLYPKFSTNPEADLLAIANNPDLITQYRHRLQSISWFMARLNEWVARKANQEDGCTGRFWDGRFKCKALLDQAAILTCLTYVDLNPIHAAIATTPEQSEFTSAQERILAKLAKEKRASLGPTRKDVSPEQKGVIADLKAAENGDQWLCPLQDTAHRRGFLNMELNEYLCLLDWTGRQVRSDKPGRIPANLEHILDRLNVAQTGWVDTVTHFDSRFYYMVGRLQKMTEAAGRAGLHWFKGIASAKIAFKDL